MVERGQRLVQDRYGFVPEEVPLRETFADTGDTLVASPRFFRKSPRSCRQESKPQLLAEIAHQTARALADPATRSRAKVSARS